MAPDGLKTLNVSTMAIVSWPQGFIVTGERCDDDPPAGECSSDSGIVQLREPGGKLVKQLELWHDEPTEAGGTAPACVGLDGTNAWIRGTDDVVEIDGTGKVIDRVQLQGHGEPCMQNGELYQVAVDSSSPDAPTQPGSNASSVASTIPAGGAANQPPAKVSMTRWAGSGWKPVTNGSLTGDSASVHVTCGGGTLAAWSNSDLTATWTATQGWVKAPTPSAPLTRNEDLDGQMTPAVASNGAVYRIDDAFHLRRLDPNSGKLVDTGLKLEPTTKDTKAPISVSVAETGSTVFACAGRTTGLPGGPSTPGTVCGFAPVPS